MTIPRGGFRLGKEEGGQGGIGLHHPGCCSSLSPLWDQAGAPRPPLLSLNKATPLLSQVLHFFVGFGALLSPLIADPFLSESSCLPANATVNATSRSHLFHASRVLGQHHAAVTAAAGAQLRPNQTLPGLTPKDGAGTRVSYAFWIMALINVSSTGEAGHEGHVTFHTSNPLSSLQQGFYMF